MRRSTKFARTRAGETIEMREPIRTQHGAKSRRANARSSWGRRCRFKVKWSNQERDERSPACGVVSTTALTVRTVTDAQGHYRLEGVPSGT